MAAEAKLPVAGGLELEKAERVAEAARQTSKATCINALPGKTATQNPKSAVCVWTEGVDVTRTPTADSEGGYTWTITFPA